MSTTLCSWAGTATPRVAGPGVVFRGTVVATGLAVAGALGTAAPNPSRGKASNRFRGLLSLLTVIGLLSLLRGRPSGLVA